MREGTGVGGRVEIVREGRGERGRARGCEGG